MTLPNDIVFCRFSQISHARLPYPVMPMIIVGSWRYLSLWKSRILDIIKIVGKYVYMRVFAGRPGDPFELA